MMQQIMSYDTGAKPAQNSVSLQGLTIATLAPVVIPLITSWFGMSDADAALVFQYIVTGAGALWGLYGVLRRCDIRLPWQKPV